MRTFGNALAAAHAPRNVDAGNSVDGDRTSCADGLAHAASRALFWINLWNGKGNLVMLARMA
ncbi:MAG: hypothetical protein AMJ84_10055 [Acidithiobacillales bacterium SM23_46]|nr:MAG: hypothetical protein AMJ84_10055 [Acidithiobacillales bacterium SM23_46]